MEGLGDEEDGQDDEVDLPSYVSSLLGAISRMVSTLMGFTIEPLHRRPLGLSLLNIVDNRLHSPARKGYVSYAH